MGTENIEDCDTSFNAFEAISLQGFGLFFLRSKILAQD